MGLRRDKTPTRFDVGAPVASDVHAQGTVVPQIRQIVRARDGSLLHLTFPAPKPAPDIINIRFLSAVPGLALPLAEGFIKAFANHEQKSRLSSSTFLRVGFVRYVVESGCQDIVLEAIDDSFVNAFIKWLDRLDETGLAVWKLPTRTAYLGAIRTVHDEIATIDKWHKNVVAKFPTHQWPGAKRQRPPPKTISDGGFALIYKACCAEMKSIRDLVAADEKAISKAIDKIPSKPTTYRDYVGRDVCLAALDKVCEKGLPCYPYLEEKHSFLLRAIKLEKLSLVDLRICLAPDPRTIIPFLLMLAIHTKLNPMTLAGSNRADYYVLERLGERRFGERPVKGRARRRQRQSVVVDESIDNPHSIFEFINHWTRRIRPHAPPSIADRLFLFIPRTFSSEVSYYNTEGTAGSGWDLGLKEFRKDHGIASFSLRQLRPSVMDIGRMLFDDDIRAAQALGDHRSPLTTNSHYKSHAQRERNQERIGEVMQVRRRWGRSKGTIDSRERPFGTDEAAATPGWNCLDPYVSPFAKAGELCDAYGMCPSCPLANLNLNSPYACGQAFNLLDAIRRSRSTMDALAWLAKAKPIEDALTKKWIPRFPQSVVEATKALSLSPLPTLE